MGVNNISNLRERKKKKMDTKTEGILQKKAMLITFSASQYTGRKKDNRARDAVSAEFGNVPDVGNYVKQSIPKERLKDIQRNINDFRTYLYLHTSPWNHKGDLLLSTALYQGVTEKARECKETHAELVKTFLDNYQDYIQEARGQLNGLFDMADYPDAWRLERKFSFDVHFSPVPASDHLKIDLAQDEIDKMQADIVNRNQSNLDAAMADVWEKVFNSVKALSEKMKKERQDKTGQDVAPIFRDSIIENIRQLVDILPGLNIAGDPGLEKARIELENELAGIDPAELRESKESRQEVAEKADEILDNLSGLFD